jgi:hypothetical protein
MSKLIATSDSQGDSVETFLIVVFEPASALVADIAGLVVSTARDICPAAGGHSAHQPSRQLAALASHAVPERSGVRRHRRQELRADMIQTVPSIHGLASHHRRHFAERSSAYRQVQRGDGAFRNPPVALEQAAGCAAIDYANANVLDQRANFTVMCAWVGRTDHGVS